LEKDNIIHLPNIKKEEKLSKSATQLYNLGKQVDHLLVGYMEHGIDNFEAAAILANRAGELLRPLDNKYNRLSFLVDIIKKQANIGK
jgi:hypothetical protein